MASLIQPILPYTLNSPVTASTTATFGPFRADQGWQLSGYANSSAAGTLYLDFTDLPLAGSNPPTPDFSQPYGSTAGVALAAGVGALIPAVVPAGKWGRLRYVNGAGAANLTYALNALLDVE